MNNKKLLIISSVLFVLGMGILLFSFFYGKNTQKAVVPEPYIPPTPVITETKPIEPVLGDKAIVERYSRIVTQRIGTFKNNDLGGIDTLQPIFESNVFKALKRVRIQSINNEDKGVEAIVSTVSFNDTKINDNVAEVIVVGQQVRTINGQTDSKDLKVTLTFSKTDKGWLITKFSL